MDGQERPWHKAFRGPFQNTCWSFTAVSPLETQAIVPLRTDQVACVMNVCERVCRVYKCVYVHMCRPRKADDRIDDNIIQPAGTGPPAPSLTT